MSKEARDEREKWKNEEVVKAGVRRLFMQDPKESKGKDKQWVVGKKGASSDELRAFTRWHTVFTIDWENVMAKDLEPYMQLSEYDNSGNPKTHWFRCVSILETWTTQDEKWQINEFGARLNVDALDWFIKVKKNITNLNDLERLFVAQFQHPDQDENVIS